ncbi:MAG: cytochrome c family protein [Syntrophothermus sp.]
MKKWYVALFFILVTIFAFQSQTNIPNSNDNNPTVNSLNVHDTNSAFFNPDSVKHAYVGAENCGMCHKSEKQGNQLGIWKNQLHSKAYETLKTERADSIAKALGFNTKAAETSRCLQCHVSGRNVDAQFIKGKFKMEDGVQCETCHGPGNDYKSAKIMGNKEEAVKNGLWVYNDIEKELCVNCHNQNSPTFKGFDFEKMWNEIKHPIPGKK